MSVQINADALLCASGRMVTGLFPVMVAIFLEVDDQQPVYLKQNYSLGRIR